MKINVLKNKKILISIIVVCVLIIIAVVVGALTSCKGNGNEYSVKNSNQSVQNSITGETIVFIGSNFAVGEKSKGESFVDYLNKIDGANAMSYSLKNATIVDKIGKKTIIKQMKSIPIDDFYPSLVVCELPYADVKKHSKIGKLTDDYVVADFNTKTVIGAMEYIACYVKSAWGCPVVFYTCPNTSQNESYKNMVNALYSVADKWNFEVIDFYNDSQFQFSKKDKQLYMVNSVSPSRAGYKEKITPKFEECLNEYIGPKY